MASYQVELNCVIWVTVEADSLKKAKAQAVMLDFMDVENMDHEIQVVESVENVYEI